MGNIKFPNAEYINKLCQTIINEKIYKIIQDNYYKNIIDIESNKIIHEANKLLKINNLNMLDKIIIVKSLIRSAQTRAAEILEGYVPEELCSQNFKQKVFLKIFNEHYYKSEAKILNTLNYIFLKELKKLNISSIEEHHAALQYFISAASNLAIDLVLIKTSLRKTLEKYLAKLNLPFFKENTTIVGQAGKEIIKILQKNNAFSREEILKVLHKNFH